MNMIDTIKLYHTFHRLREDQAWKYHGRAPTAFERQMTETVFSVCFAALQDHHAAANGTLPVRRPGANLRILTAQTGTGKSTGTAALAVAGLLTDPAFSAAFVVETAVQAQEMYEHLMALVPEELRHEVMVWTTAHDRRTEDAVTHEKYRVDPTKPTFRRSHKEWLPGKRLVVVTHTKLKNEQVSGGDAGVRFWQGRRRNLVIIDEQPEFVKMTTVYPHYFQAFLDGVRDNAPDHPWLPVLKGLAEKVAALKEAKGAPYAAVGLDLRRDEVMAFGNPTVESLRRFVVKSAKGEQEMAKYATMCRDVVTFLQAAWNGYVFHSRQDGDALVAYRPDLVPEPGMVLMDATADLSGVVELMGSKINVKAPEVDYRDLKLEYLPMPEAFAKERVSRVAQKAGSRADYGLWMRDSIVQHTKPGDKVLVVTHKAIQEAGGLPDEGDPKLGFFKQPLYDCKLVEVDEDGRKTPYIDIKGRLVKTLTYGRGIGANSYRHCTTVILFGLYYVKKSTIIGNVLGIREQAFNDAIDISRAISGKMSGDYERVYLGHLLRWTKQLATRGSCRVVSKDGVAAPMRLITTMPPEMLMEHYQGMFPGAERPTLVEGHDEKVPKDAKEEPLMASLGKFSVIEGEKDSGSSVLAKVLTTAAPGSVFWASDFEAATGVAAKRFRQTIDQSDHLKALMALYGWRFVTAKEMGLKGKRLGVLRGEACPRAIALREEPKATPQAAPRSGKSSIAA